MPIPAVPFILVLFLILFFGPVAFLNRARLIENDYEND